METLHNTTPEESRIYVVLVLVILWDVLLKEGIKLAEGEASVMIPLILLPVGNSVLHLQERQAR